ncbi:DedA family protein [Streptomyces albus]|uniref:DedA family protein n=1 Tax=Streptomyces albus TaxID=1888 RepID=UPI0033EE4290
MTNLALGPSWLDPDFLIQTFGPVGILAIVFAESGLLIGFFLPGDSLLFTTGLLIVTDQLHMSLWLMCLLIVLAAVLGDQAGYLFGKKVGPALFRRPDSRLFKQENVEKAHEFFEKHGPKSLVLARFVPVVRTFTPIIAGVSGMKYRSFIIFNVIGGTLWGAGVTLLGAALGQVDFVHEHIEMILVGIVALSVVPIVIEYLRARGKGSGKKGDADEAPAQDDSHPPRTPGAPFEGHAQGAGAPHPHGAYAQGHGGAGYGHGGEGAAGTPGGPAAPGGHGAASGPHGMPGGHGLPGNGPAGHGSADPRAAGQPGVPGEPGAFGGPHAPAGHGAPGSFGPGPGGPGAAPGYGGHAGAGASGAPTGPGGYGNPAASGGYGNPGGPGTPTGPAAPGGPGGHAGYGAFDGGPAAGGPAPSGGYGYGGGAQQAPGGHGPQGTPGGYGQPGQGQGHGGAYAEGIGSPYGDGAPVQPGPHDGAPHGGAPQDPYAAGLVPRDPYGDDQQYQRPYQGPSGEDPNHPGQGYPVRR